MSIVGKSSQYYSGFSPLLIPGCALWLDGADTSSLTLSGNNVTSWRDKSGNGRNATVTGGAPTRSTAGFGGRQSVLFNGTADSMGGTMSITSNVLTAFALFQPTALRDTVSDQRVLTFASGTNPDWNSIERTTGINIQAGIYNNQITTYRNSTFIARSGTAVTVGGQFIGVAQYNGVNGLVFMNGTAGVIINASSGNFNILNYGVANQPTPTGERLYGYIAEMIVFAASLTTAERQQVEGYLAGKWGLRANIPTTHPFKSLTPFARPFVPVDISGCSLWLDAADSRTVVLSGADVTQWSDKSGNARHATQTTSTLRPTYSTDRNAIVFPNLKYLNMTDAFNMLSAVGRFYSIYVVERRRSNKVQNFMVAFGGSAGNVGIAFGYNDNTTFSHTAAYVADTLYTVAGYQVTDPIRIWSGGYNGTIRDLVLNGTTVTTTPYTYAITGWTQPCIGFLPLVGINQYFVGDIHEILFYNSYLTVNQRQQIETYLANKWSIVGSTPVAHPARLTRALVPSFNPRLIEGCSLWLDAADTGSITLSGSNVTQWNDKSGNGRNAVVSSNAYATLSGTPQGLLFNNSFYTTTLSADPAIETGFVVYNVSSAGVLVGAYNAGREIAFQSLTIIGLLKAQIAWGPVATTAGNVRQLVTTFASSSATSTVVNGGTAVTGGGLTFTSGNVTTLGREVGTNFPYGGFIHEIVLFSANLTISQRKQVEGYLANKWGIANNLPSEHPFKVVRP